MDELDAGTKKVLDFSEKAIGETGTFSVELDSDPSDKGILSLHSKIAYVQSCASRTTTLICKCVKVLSQTEAQFLNADKLKREISLSILKENDFFKAAKTAGERDGRVEAILQDDHKEVWDQWYKFKIRETVLIRTYKHLKLVLDEMDLASTNISRQLNAIEKQILIGEISIVTTGNFRDVPVAGKTEL